MILDESCAHLQEAVSAFARVRIFRRKDGFRSASTAAAEELYRELEKEGELGRGIYVAASFAGFTALLLASNFPQSILGLLLLDPSHPRQGPEAWQILEDAPPNPELERLRALLAGFGPAWDQSCRDVTAIRGLGDVPLHVMAGGTFDLPCELPAEVALRLLRSRQAMLSEYCLLSARASFEVVESAGHDLSRQAPEAVRAAIGRLVAIVKQKGGA